MARYLVKIHYILFINMQLTFPVYAMKPLVRHKNGASLKNRSTFFLFIRTQSQNICVTYDAFKCIPRIGVGVYGFGDTLK